MTSSAVIERTLIERMDRAHAAASAAQRELLRQIAEAERSGAWEGSGARDLAHFVSIRYGISWWKADRWVRAARALEGLPCIAEALESGSLGIDKVVELCRFATAETEEGLIRWAAEVSPGAIRRRADVEARRERADTEDAVRDRRLEWWYLDEGRRFAIEGELPAADGAVVARALDRLAQRISAMPGEEDACFAPARRADALVALCLGGIDRGGDADRATVVVHARLDRLAEGSGGEVEDGPAVHAETVRRLLCDARVQLVLEDGAGNVLGLGRTSRTPSPSMVRQVRYRDRECRFPGCGARQFTEAHHVVWWRHGGRTDLDNLLLICSFHHRLVHELGWSVTRLADGTVEWFHPDGTRYRAGPATMPLHAAG